MEERLATRDGLAFIPVRAPMLRRSLSLRNLAVPVDAGLGIWQAVRALRASGVAAVFGTGAHVALPGCAAAVLLGLPLFLQEQNAAPGIVTRLFAPKARRVYLGFVEAAKRLKGAGTRALACGNPAQTPERRWSRAEARQRLGLSPARLTLFVTGGSRGAVFLNQTVAALAERVAAQGWNLIWQTGENWTPPPLPQALSGRARVAPFFDRDEMNLAYSAADFAVTRSGAMTVAELAVYGLPAVLVPYPYATGGHQESNARAVEAQGAALVITQSELTPETLWAAAVKLLDPQRRGQMSQAAAALAKPDAAAIIAGDILTNLRVAADVESELPGAGFSTGGRVR